MRTQAREIAFKRIFESFFTDSEELLLEEMFQENKIEKEEDKKFAETLVQDFFAHKEEIKDKIDKNLIDYSPERIYKIDRAILSLAITELFYYKDTPIAIVINEAVEMAKKYGTDKSYAFVNGILKTISQEI